MKSFKLIRRAGVPIASIESSDPAATIKECVAELNGKADKTPILEWCVIRGLRGINDVGVKAFQDLTVDPMITLNPSEFLRVVEDSARISNILQDAVIFMHSANRFVNNEAVQQAVWNCRDVFAARHMSLILLGPGIALPDELKQDVIVVSEPLPGDDILIGVCKRIFSDADIPEEKLEPVKAKALDTLRGLSAFAASQVVAMSLTKNGLDMAELIKLKRSYISQLPGVEVREDKITFDDIAGYDNVKTILRRKIEGRRPPRLVLWLDELEKQFAGNETDSTGVSQDQTSQILQWMQDRLNEDRLSAMMLIGFPGTGKSAISMALKNESQCEGLRLDLGGMKDSYVGNSEKKIRGVLKVVDAMSSGHIMLIATCNSVGNLPAPLISRFAFGQYMFDLPSTAERTMLWELKRKKYSIPSDDITPESTGWTGREVQQCCFLANDLNMPLVEAAKYITPFCSTSKREIELLRSQANRRFLSATTPGFYIAEQAQLPVAATGRKMDL